MSKGKYKNKKKNSIKDDTTNVSIQKKKQSNQKKQYTAVKMKLQKGSSFSLKDLQFGKICDIMELPN